MSTAERPGLVVRSVWFAPPLALFFLLLEVLKASRSASWSGFTTEQIVGLLVGGLMYAAVLAVLGALLAVLLAPVARGRLLQEATGPLGTLLGGVVVWGVLSVHREYAPTPDDVLVLGALAILGMGYVAVRALGVGKAYPLILTLALGSGLAVYLLLSGASLYRLDRLHLVLAPTALAILAVGFLALSAAFYVIRLKRVPVFGIVSGLPLLFALVIALWPHTGQAPGPPNVVFVVADTLRADYLSVQGGDVPTPALEELAADGAVFDEAISLAPWTMPSMQGMWTSQYPAGFSPNGTVEEWVDQSWRYCRDTGVETLAEKLKARGYETGALIANALVWGMPDIMRGYDFRVMSHPIMLAPAGRFSAMPFLADVLKAWWPSLLDIRPHDTTRALDRFAQSWLSRYRKAPFYLYVHYIDPHAPYDPPGRYRTLTGAWPFFYPYPGGERWGIPILGPDHYVPEEHRAYVTDLYKGEVRYIDEFVGRLMGYLEDAGMADNTLVVFTSDHGEELWEHGEFAHGQSLHVEQMHVPLIVRGPGVVQQRLAERTSLIDVLPTVAGLLDLDPEASWQGRDLSAALRGEEPLPPTPPVFGQATNNKCYPWPQQMVMDGDWKLIREHGSDGRMLYNVVEDPGETANLAAQHPERVAELEAKLDAWLAGFDSTFKTGGEDVPAGMTQEAVDQLRGMGYL